MSRLSMQNGKIVLTEDNKPKQENSNSRLSMENGRIVLAEKQTPAVNTAKNSQYRQRTQAAQRGYEQMDAKTNRTPQSTQNRNANTSNGGIMDRALNMLRDRVSNSKAVSSMGEWADKVGNKINQTWQVAKYLNSPEGAADKEKIQKAREDAETKRRQWEIENANIIDEASNLYQPPTRTEIVKGTTADLSGADMFSNDWAPEGEVEYDFKRTVANPLYNPLSREERDKLIARWQNAMSGDIMADEYQDLLYNVTKNGGIEQLYKEQQADAANDREYSRQLHNVNIDDMSALERLWGTVSNTVSGGGKQVVSSLVGNVAYGLNRTADMASQDDSITSYKSALEQAARRWYYELYNGSDNWETEESIRQLAEYVGGEAYADRLVARVRERADEAINTGNATTYGLLDDIKPDENKIWENSQKIIADSGIYDTINYLNQSAQEDIQYAKDVNLIQSKLGDNLVEAGVSTVQNIADAVAAIPITMAAGPSALAMLPFAFRAFGGSYAEQMQDATQYGQMVGMDTARRAAQTAGISAGVEVGTELMWGMVGAMSKMTGGGALDDFAQDKLSEVLKKIPHTEAGKTMLAKIGNLALGGVTEGLEEVIGDAAEQILKNAGIMPGEGMEWDELKKEMVHSFVTGALGGLMGEVTGVVSNPMQQSQIGKQLKSGALDITADELVSLAQSEAMSGTSLGQEYLKTAKNNLPLFGEVNTESLSDRDLGKLYEAYQETLDKKTDAMTTVNELVDKVRAGEDLRRSDVNRITQNPDAVSYLVEQTGMSRENSEAFNGDSTERKAAVNMALRALASDSVALSEAQAENVQAGTENANTAVSAPNPFYVMNQNVIDNVLRQAQPLNAAENARQTPYEVQKGEVNMLRDVYSVAGMAEKLGASPQAQDMMSRMYLPSQDKMEYTSQMTKYMEKGRKNENLDLTEESILTPAQKQAGWNIGRMETIANRAREEINNGRSEAGAEVFLRNGGERYDGENPVGSPGSVVENAGENQAGQTGYQQGSGSARQVYNGLKVGKEIAESELNAKSMAAAGYEIVTDTKNDKDAAEVEAFAKKHKNVREVIMWRGGAVPVIGKTKSGKAVAERGFTIRHDDGTVTIGVQLDDEDWSGSRIATHELAHFLIYQNLVKGNDILGRWNESGEKSLGTIRDMMIGLLGSRQKFENAIRDYASAYAGANLIERTDDGGFSDDDMQYVYEEMICDYVAGMNAFVESGKGELAHKSAPVMVAAQEAFERANGTRGSPSATEINRGETARAMEEVVDSPVKASISIAKAIADRAVSQAKDNKAAVQKAHDDIRNILIPIVEPLMGKMDKNGMPLVPEESSFSPNIFSNGSYGFDAEPTTECYRQMGYRALAKMVTDKLGRPLTNIEAIIVNQAAVEIAIDPPCLYCYSLLDRKAKEAYKIQYLNERDSFEQMFERDYGKDRKALLKDIDKQLNHDVNSGSYYSIYLNNGKGTRTDNKDKKARVRLWMEMWANNIKGVSLLDVRNMEAEEKTASHLNTIENKTIRDYKKKSLQDVQKWVQAASQAKKYIPYSAYTNSGKGNLLDWKQSRIDLLNSEYGLRWYSHADFHPAFAIDNMQQVIDASIKGLKGLMYCKPIAAAKIMAPTGMNINVSCFAQFKDGKYISDDKLGANWDEVKALRDQYNNVGSVMVVTSDDMLLWALSQDWVDVVIPLHRVRSGSEFIQEFGLSDYTGQQADKADKTKFDEFMAAYAQEHQLTDKQAASAGKKMKAVYPAEHQNNYDTYLNICKERGLTPRFEKIRNEILTGNYSYDGVKITPQMYMKLVNETRQSESQTQPLQPVFDMDAAKEAVESLKTQGYFEYFKDSSEWTQPNGKTKTMTLNDWADQAVKDIKAGKKPSALGYGRDLAVNANGQYITTSKQAKAEGLSGIHKASAALNRDISAAEKISAEEASKPITLEDIRALQRIGRISINDFTEADIATAQKWAHRFYRQLGEKSPFFRAWFGEWRAHSVAPANIVSFAYGENGKIDKKPRSVKNRDTGFDVKVDGAIYGDSYHYAVVNNEKNKITKLLGKLDEIIENAILFDTQLSEPGKSEKKGSTAFMHYLFTPVTINGAPFIAKLEIEEYGVENSRRAYNLQRIEMSEVSRAQFSQILEENRGKYAYTSDALSVAQLYEFVKSKDEKISYAKSVDQNLLNKDGTPKVLYHQTGADIEEFSNENPSAGKNDSETPNGFFAKDNDHDIGLAGKKQMPIYMSMQNPLHFANREEANAWYCKNVSGYKALQDEMHSKLKPIDQEMARIENEMFKVDGEEYDKLEAEWDKKHEEMGKVEDEYRGKLRGLLDDYFLNGKSEYDGIILDYDGHRYVDGKRENVKTYIAFDNTQIKSASDNIGTFDKTGRIRYSSSLSNLPSNADETARKVVENLRKKAKLNDLAAKYGSFKATAYTDERIAREIEYSYATGERSKDYARAYIAFVSPEDFIDATSSRSWRGNLYQQVADKAKEESRESMLDLDALQNERQSMFLRIEATEDGRARIVGHEGRHRMIGLEKEGYKYVPVIIEPREGSYPDGQSRYSTKPIDMLWLNGQEFGAGNGTSFVLHDILPLSSNYADIAKEIFAGGQNVTKFSSSLSQAYMTAAERGDTRTARRLVRQAAESSGYTVEGYHGTEEFGFTKIDTKLSDDKLSFFVTNDLNTARTYSTKNSIRKISDKELSPEEAVKEQEQAYEEARSSAIDFATVLSQMAGIQGWADVKNITNELEQQVANFEDDFAHDIETFHEELWGYLDQLTWDLFDFTHEEMQGDIEAYEEWWDSDEVQSLRDAYENVSAAYTSYATLEESNENAGNYHVYINPDGIFTIDCKGKRWDSIDGDGKAIPETNHGRYWNTRTIARWAKDNGYTGVLFQNVIDDGGKGGKRASAADVYSLFNPQAQVKSADPITYDDAGNIIPLEERFNPKNDDIRYSASLRTQSAQELIDANRQLQKDLTELRSKLKTRTEQYKYWKGQTKVTEGRHLRTEDVTKLAREIIKGQESSADAKAVAEKMKALGEYLLNSQDENVYDEARLKAYEVAHDILANAKTLNTKGGDDFYSDFRTALKNQMIYVAPSVREEVAPDGWNDFRKAQYGTVNMTADKSKGKSVDKVYHDLQATFGEWLLPEYIASEADQLNKILEIIETYRPVYENLNSYEMADAVEWTANEILTRIIGEEIRETNPTYADRMEKKLADQKAKAQTALKQVRQQRDRKVADLKQHYQQVAEDRRNRKIDSEMRSRLLKIAKRLTNKKLDRATRALLDQYIGEIDLVSKGILGRTIRDIEHLQDFYDAYKEKMGEDFVPDISIENRIKRLSKKHINDLTQEEVAELTTVLLNIETMLRTKDKLLESKIKGDVYAAGMQTIDDINNSNGDTGFLAKFIGAETATPERYIHRVTGYRENSPLYQAAKELSDGQRKMLDYQMRAEAMFKEWTTDTKFIRRIAGKHAEELTVQGIVDGEKTNVVITPAMRMALYLHEKNDDNMHHISQGGVKIPDMKLYKKGDMDNAYAKGQRVIFTRGMIKNIAAGMSAKEKAFADAVYRYYNGMSRNEINDVSEILKGFAIAGVENYFPIQTNNKFLAKTFDAIKRDGSIEGMGFLKERIDNASTPIMLYDLNTVLNRSISQHSKYVGLAIPVRNFEKLYNVTTFTDKGVDFKNNPLDPGWRYDTSIAETLTKNWGETAARYVEKMLADVENGTGLKDDTWGDLLAKARSKYAGAVLTTNASVAMKQAASYPTAAAVVGYGPLMRALADVSKIDLDKLAEYTPLLWYRSKGFSTTELGDIGKEGGHIPKALNWIQAIDVATTTKLAKAAMYYVNENNKNLTRGTDAWWKAVADVYNRIIEETQPNYTMMQRPQILRSDNALTRALNMFKTQPFQNFNILYDAFGNLAAKSREYKANATEENLQALKSARTNAVRAVTSQAVSAFVFALMQFAWDAFRGKAKKYKDDDDEMTFLSWLKGMGINVLSSAGGMIPFGSYALELGETMVDAIVKAFGGKAVFGQTFYGLSENAAESVNDMGKALINMVTKTAQAIEGGEVTESTIRSIVDSAADIAQFAGIPMNNVLNLFKAIARNALLKVDGKYVGGYEALRVTTDPAKYKSDYYDLLKKAWLNDPEAFEEIRKRMINATGDPFATAKTSAEDNIAEKVKEWTKEKVQTESFYQDTRDNLQASGLWDKATPEQQKKVMNSLLSLAVGDEKLTAAVEGGKEVGIDATEYMLYKLALQMADADGNGTIKQSEAEAAVNMLTGLTTEEKAYLFQSTNSSWKSNPFNVTRGGSMPNQGLSQWARTRNIAGVGGDVYRTGDGMFNGYGISMTGKQSEKRKQLEASPGADVYRTAYLLAAQNENKAGTTYRIEQIINSRAADFTGAEPEIDPVNRVLSLLAQLSQDAEYIDENKELSVFYAGFMENIRDMLVDHDREEVNKWLKSLGF